jgi:hypothetical protein
MKFFHWVLVALFLAVPYSNQGSFAALFDHAQPAAPASLESRAVGLCPLGVAEAGRTSPLSQQASAHAQYRSAFSIASFKSGSCEPAPRVLAALPNQIFRHFLDDIFHPPA